MEYASLPDQLSSSGRVVIVGPIHRKCPEVVVVAVDKIFERCRQATEQTKGGDGFGDTAAYALEAHK
jgi:hypothetical protein